MWDNCPSLTRDFYDLIAFRRSILPVSSFPANPHDVASKDSGSTGMVYFLTWMVIFFRGIYIYIIYQSDGSCCFWQDLGWFGTPFQIEYRKRHLGLLKKGVVLLEEKNQKKSTLIQVCYYTAGAFRNTLLLNFYRSNEWDDPIWPFVSKPPAPIHDSNSQKGRCAFPFGKVS